MLSADDAIDAIRLIVVILVGGYVIYYVAKTLIGF
jgi:hypothetical protein